MLLTSKGGRHLFFRRKTNLVLIIAYDLKPSRKCKKVFVIPSASCILVIRLKIRFTFKVNYILKHLTLKILKFCFNVMGYQNNF